MGPGAAEFDDGGLSASQLGQSSTGVDFDQSRRRSDNEPFSNSMEFN